MPAVTLHHGDCLDILKTMEPESVDAVVTDPPYDLTAGKKGGTGEASLNLSHPAGRARITTGGGFMGKEWDSTGVAFDPATWQAVMRVMKPGAYLVAFGGTRTHHRLMCAIEDAGLELRETLLWVHGQGMPKGRNIAKAFDQAAGIDTKAADWTPTTDLAKQWDGWNSQLKPSYEPVILAQKPYRGSVEANVVRWGVGGLNVGATRIALATGDRKSEGGATASDSRQRVSDFAQTAGNNRDGLGRYPSHLLLSHSPNCRPVGVRRVKGGVAVRRNGGGMTVGYSGHWAGWGEGTPDATYADPDGTELVTAWECDPGCPIALLDEQAGERVTHPGTARRDYAPGMYGPPRKNGTVISEGSRGGASRFFQTFAPDSDPPPALPIEREGTVRMLYQAKAPPSERWGVLSCACKAPTGIVGPVASLRAMLPKPCQACGAELKVTSHPTQKPTALMEWLVRLVCPPGGTVLDCFMGSGSTGCACIRLGVDFVGVDADAEYVAIAEKRIAHWAPRQQRLTLEVAD